MTPILRPEIYENSILTNTKHDIQSAVQSVCSMTSRIDLLHRQMIASSTLLKNVFLFISRYAICLQIFSYKRRYYLVSNSF